MERAGYYATRHRRRYTQIPSPNRKHSCHQPLWSYSSVPWRVVVVSLLFVAFGAKIMLNVFGPQGWIDGTKHHNSWTKLHMEGSSVDLPTITTVRVYRTYSEEPPEELYHWEHVVEPYRTAMMEVATSRPGGVLMDYVNFR